MKDKDRIKQLEEQLAQKHIYVHEIHTLHCSDGELYLGYGEKDECLVINVDTFYKDLPSIISMVVKENTKQQEMYADMIKESLTEL
tara:strand:- start:323 stop:580 length:258 start_codon:yes stop_codon:yes gene_type:complete